MTTSIGSSYPLPIAITVRNVFPPLAILNNVSTPQVESDTATINDERHCESDNNTIQSKQQTTNSSSIKQSLSSKISSSSVEDRCALVSREVLLRLRLDIVTKPISKCSNEQHSNDTEEIDDDTSNCSKETLVYSSEQPSSTSHPKWDHVDEYLSTLFNDEDIDKNCNVLYARFVILPDTTNDDNDPSSVDIKECLLAEIPLHPSKLRRLPTITSNDDQDTNNNNNNTMIIPNPLPPNTILLHYNDGYTRTIPNIYWTLVQRGIICESIVDPVIKRYGSGEEYSGAEKKDTGDDERFEDKAFNVLPGDDVESKQSEESDEEKLNESYSSNQQDNTAIARDNAQTTDDKVFDLLGEAEGTSSKAQPNEVTTKLTDTMSIPDPSENGEPNLVAEEFEQSTEVLSQENEETPQSLLPELPPLSISADYQTTQDEIEELRRLIKVEQHLLEEEQRSIQQGTNHVKSIMQQVHQLENETLEIMRAVGVEKSNLFTSEFRLDAHRIHLLQHLKLIFPIKLVPINISVNPPHLPQHQYTIAGLPIPDDIHSPTSTDDQVSTALGFLCHLVSLTSKYLAIPLRYTLVCKFSRSAVLFDQGRDRANGNGKMSRVVYPLFRERGVIDREQLDYGLLLLGRNVDCLLHTRQVATHPAMNILAKMNKLIEKIVEGDRP